MLINTSKRSAGTLAQTPVAAPVPAKPAKQNLHVHLEELLADRQGPLPVWVRAPAHGQEFFSGTSRAKLYEWDAKGYIRSVSIREPGKLKGCRLFHLGSILAFIEKCEREAQTRDAATDENSATREREAK